MNWETQFDWSLGLSSVSCYSTVMLLNAAQSGPAQSSCPAVPQTTILLLPGPSKVTCSIYNYRKVPHIHCQLHTDADYSRAVSTSVRPTDDVCSLCQGRLIVPNRRALLIKSIVPSPAVWGCLQYQVLSGLCRYGHWSCPFLWAPPLHTLWPLCQMYNWQTWNIHTVTCDTRTCRKVATGSWQKLAVMKCLACSECHCYIKCFRSVCTWDSEDDTRSYLNTPIQLGTFKANTSNNAATIWSILPSDTQFVTRSIGRS